MYNHRINKEHSLSPCDMLPPPPPIIMEGTSETVSSGEKKFLKKENLLK